MDLQVQQVAEQEAEPCKTTADYMPIALKEQVQITVRQTRHVNHLTANGQQINTTVISVMSVY